MNFKANSFIDHEHNYACTFKYDIGKRSEYYTFVYPNDIARENDIRETKYYWLQLNLERVVNNIRYLAANIYQEYYSQFQHQIDVVQQIKMSFKHNTPPEKLIEKISEHSETFYKLTPPRDSKHYKSLKSQITALVLYCEIN